MKLLRFRYLSALCVNFALPWLAYRLAYPHGGALYGLLASAVPLIAWIVLDLLRFRHFDALSAQVLIGVTLSIVVLLLGAGPHTLALEQPMVAGMIGLAFLASLTFRRPMVYYLARSTVARESHDGAAAFEQYWRDHPDLAPMIRNMTLVWGLGLAGENLLRCLIVWHWGNSVPAQHISDLVSYGAWTALTLWTFWRRKTFKSKHRPDYDQKTSSVAS
jgi:hypothetical protein